MKQSVIVFTILMVPVIWLLYRPQLSIFKARLGRAVRVAGIVYFLILAAKLWNSSVDEQQIALAAASILLFAGVWAVAWLVTRAIERTR